MRFAALFLTLGAILWIASILPSEYLRLKHRSIISSIKQEQAIDLLTLEEAIQDYQAFSSYHFCHGDFYKDWTILTMLRFARYETKNDFDQMDNALSNAINTINKHLNCQPKDGNGWLTKAIIHVQQAGFSQAAMDAYKQSAFVTPREAWLAQKRSYFILRFLPLLDKAAHTVALNDIETLKEASSNRQRQFRQAIGVESLDTLLIEMRKFQPTPSPN